jgi:hypothetical protein
MKITILLAILAALAGCNPSTSVPAPETAASAPTVGTKGAGGGGW